MGAIKSVETGKTEIISEADWNNLTKKVNLLSQRSNVKSQQVRVLQYHKYIVVGFISLIF